MSVSLAPSIEYSGIEKDPCSEFVHFQLPCKIANFFDGLFGDPSGLPAVEEGGPGIYPIHAATGHGYSVGYAANSHRYVPDAWLAAVKYLVEEHGADVNERDYNGSTPLLGTLSSQSGAAESHRRRGGVTRP